MTTADENLPHPTCEYCGYRYISECNYCHPLHDPKTCGMCQLDEQHDATCEGPEDTDLFDSDDFYMQRASRMAGLGIIGAFVVSGLFWWAVFALVTR